MMVSHSLLTIIPAAILLFAACGSIDGGPEVDVTDASSTTTGQVEPDPDDPTGPDKPATIWATLPVGGDSEPLDGMPGVVCAVANWLLPADAPSIPEGVSVRVTGHWVEPRRAFVPAEASCDGDSCLDGFVFTADSPNCQVAMRYLPEAGLSAGESALFGLSGEMTCPTEPCKLEVTNDETQAKLYVPDVTSGPTDPSEPTDPVERTDSVEPTDSVESTDSVEPTDPVEPAVTTNSTE